MQNKILFFALKAKLQAGT